MSRAATQASARPQRPRVRATKGFWARQEDRALRVPASVMVPRLVLIGAAVGLLAFGLVMLFSASSIKGLTETEDNPAIYLLRQLAGVAVGLALGAVIVKVGYRNWAQPPLLWLIVGLSFVLLLIVVAVGTASHGATRWIRVGSFSLQPAEFVKATVIATTAYLCTRRPQRSFRDREFLVPFLGIVGGLLFLILVQPDKGTTLVLTITVICLLLAAGFDGRVLGVIAVGGGIAFLVMCLITPYTLQRFLVAWNPEADPYGSGYQLVQGIYALGSGGLWGVGLGMGTQKYAYLPEMHNDFILAVVGEELGALGILVVLALFALLFWACWKIALQAPDERGRLIALGVGIQLVASLMLNLLGVLCLVPLSGKAVPFVSYGASAIAGSLVLVSMALSVSMASALPETEHDRKRGGLALVPQGAAGPAEEHRPGAAPSGAGTPRARSFRLLEGGASSGRDGASRSGTTASSRREALAPPARRGGLSAHPEARLVKDSRGRERIELGRSPSDRLRPASGPEVRRTRATAADRAPRRR